MTKPDIESMVKEIRYDLTRRDSGKAQIVLSYLGSLDADEQKRLLLELGPGDAEFVLPLLAYLMENHPHLCASQPLIREMLLSKALDYPDLLLRFLRDEACDHRLTYIDIIGEIRLEKAVLTLIEILMTATEVPLLKSVMQALGLIGLSEATSPLADFLYVMNRDLVVCAVRAMGGIGSPSAMHRLSERMGTDNELDLLILEIFSDVQDNISLRKLTETLGSHHAHMRNYARTLLVKIGPKSVPFLLANLNAEDADLQINSLNALGEIADASAFTPIRKLLHSEPRNPNVRFAAYEALSLLPMQQGAYVLAGGLVDPVEHVRIAAARAIDRNYGEILSAGIKNMVRFKDEDAERIVRTVIHAQADKIFLDLAGEAVFQDLALAFLAQTHLDLRRHYEQLTMNSGFPEFAAKIRPEEVETVKKLRACAVDDSRMILSIYKNTLHELGVEPVLFEFPASAIEWLEKEKPDILFTDLNMPEITGIDLVRKVRLKYSAEALPIVMVTTQSDIQDHEAARTAGINKLIFKPFDAPTLKAALSELVKV